MGSGPGTHQVREHLETTQLKHLIIRTFHNKTIIERYIRFVTQSIRLCSLK